MKKKLIRTTSLLLVACLLFLSGCQNPGDAPAKTPEEFWARPHEWQSEQLSYYRNANEYGYYYQDGNNILMYLDYATRKSAALCSRVGCKHNDYACEAFSLNPPYMFFREEKMYLILDNNEGIHIFVCDLDMTNRESKIILMKDEMEKGNAVGVGCYVVNGDELYYLASYQEPIGEPGEKMRHSIKAVRRVDLKSWTDEEICRSVEFEYRITGADADGVLIFERPDVYVWTKVDFTKPGKAGERQSLFTREEQKQMPVNVFYWDKKTGSRLNLYESNYDDTYYVGFAKGSCIYRLGLPEGSTVTSLEKMDMRTGESEWLWREKAGPQSMPTNCSMMNDHIYITVMKGDAFFNEFYTADGFEKIELPFFNEKDDIIYFENEHGYVVDRTIEYRPDNPSGDISDIVFIPMEEADKADPEYTVLKSYGRD